MILDLGNGSTKQGQLKVDFLSGFWLKNQGSPKRSHNRSKVNLPLMGLGLGVTIWACTIDQFLDGVKYV